MEFALSNLALRHLIEENQILINGFINKVQTTDDNLLKLKIHTKQGDKTVIVNNNSIFISKTSISAKQNPGGFSSFIKKFIFNQRIISIKQKEFDRIVVIEFNDVFLIFELFSKGNVILCDKNYKIIRSMKKEKWKDRELKKDEFYKFPSSKGKNPLEINENDFFKELKSNKKTVFGAILDILNVAPGLIDFLFDSEKWDKKIDAEKIDLKKSSQILREIQKIYSKKGEGVFIIKNIIYSVNIGVEKKFDTITDFLNYETFKTKELPEKKESVKIISRGEEYKKQIQKHLVDADNFQKLGESIYLNYPKLNQMMNIILDLKKKDFLDNQIEKELNHQFKSYSISLKKEKLIIEF